MKSYPIVALGSGKASTIEFFCKKIHLQNPALFKIKALITENPNSGVAKVAKKFNLPCHVLEYKRKDFVVWDNELCQILLKYNPHLILLAGFLKKIGPIVLKQFQNKIINSHPSLLPDFSGFGMYGLKIHQAVVAKQKKQTGVSIHIVNKNYDEGSLLAQKKISIRKGESALELEEKVKKIEKIFYFETVLKIIKKQILLNRNIN